MKFTLWLSITLLLPGLAFGQAKGQKIQETLSDLNAMLSDVEIQKQMNRLGSLVSIEPTTHRGNNGFRILSTLNGKSCKSIIHWYSSCKTGISESCATYPVLVDPECN